MKQEHNDQQTVHWRLEMLLIRLAKAWSKQQGQHSKAAPYLISRSVFCMLELGVGGRCKAAA